MKNNASEDVKNGNNYQSDSETKLYVTDIQRFCMHDGDGVRTTVFLKGCPLRCSWCHNPETQSKKQQILFYPSKCAFCRSCVAVCPSGAHIFKNGSLQRNADFVKFSESETDSCTNISICTEQSVKSDFSNVRKEPEAKPEHIFKRELCIGCGKCADICNFGALEKSLKIMTVGEILGTVQKDRAFYGKKGGVTLSGGEPMFQPDEAISFLRQCKLNNLNTALETSGYFDSRYIEELIPLVDCFLWDFKDGNDERHKLYTGVSNKKIIDNLFQADALGAKTVLRCIIVKQVNTEKDHLDAIAEVFKRLHNCRYVELLPYHAYAGSKMLPLGMADNGRVEWIPDEIDIESIRNYLRSLNVKVK